MEKTENKQVSRHSFRTLVYCVLFSLIGGCAMQTATAEDVAQAELEDQTRVVHREDVVANTVPTGDHATTSVPSQVLTLPSAPLPSGVADQCRCAWGSWSSGSGLMCAGIRCNEFCDMATRGCVERHACVPAGI